MRKSRFTEAHIKGTITTLRLELASIRFESGEVSNWPETPVWPVLKFGCCIWVSGRSVMVKELT